MARKRGTRRRRARKGKATDGILAPKPLTEAQLARQLKPRNALRSAPETTIEVDVLVATRRKAKSTTRITTGRGDAILVRQAGVAREARAGGAARLRLTVKGVALGARAFPPSVAGKLVKLQALSSRERSLARQGLPDLEGYLPDHLPLQPVPPRLEKSLQVRRYLSPNAGRPRRGETLATTIFAPDNRYTFSDTSFPWCTTGRVDTPAGTGSGVMVGPRHMLTCSHCISWIPFSNECRWVQFRPSYFDGSTPFGEAWAIRWYAYRKVVGPSLSRAESREDYAVLVLDRRLGDTVGWMGARTYSDSWDGDDYWRHIGYPGDLAASERPSYQRDIALDGSFWDGSSHQRAYHEGDVWPGQSGGPFFAWWSGESWPRVVAVQSGENDDENLAAAGSRLVNLIIQARNDYP